MSQALGHDSACAYCGLPVSARRVAPTPDARVFCCYGCQLAAEITGASGEAGQANWILVRLGTGIALSMAVMMFSLPNYGVDVYHVADASTAFAGQWTSLLRYLSLLLSLPVFFLLGWPIFANSIESARRGVLTTDALIVVGVAASLVYSYVRTITESGGVYFETACMILVLVTLGRYLEAIAKLKATSAIRSLDALLPDEVEVTRQGVRSRLPLREVMVGDLVHVSAGQAMAVDGTIEHGRAHVDESAVTGESAPVVKEIGDRVRAGTINLDGALTIRAQAVGHDNAIGRIVSLLEQARNHKGRYGRLADRITTVFVPLVSVLAVATTTWRFSRGAGGEAVMTGLAVLLISCPCALGIATPLATWTALGRAARKGVLFKDVDAIERLARIRAVSFDKTGTLTTGSPRVTSFTGSSHDGKSESDWIILAAGLGRESNHALSRAIVAYGSQLGLQPMRVSAVQTIAGRGVVGRINGAEVRLGSPRMFEEQNANIPAFLQRSVDLAMERAAGIACIGWGRETVGVFEFSEELRPEARSCIDELRNLRIEVEILTGDHAPRAQALAESLGVSVSAQLMPNEKHDYVQQWRRRVGPVAMVGDGLNDAPALAGADVGLALGCGADVSREAADVCLVGNDLRLVPFAVKLARATIRTIRVNLFWAFIYNIIGIPLAIAGKLNPSLAAIAMVLSSLLVVANSTRLGREDTEILRC